MRRINQKGFGVLQLLLIMVLVGIVGAAGYYVYNAQSKKEAPRASITNFDECVAAGNPVMESFPEQCAANGQTFTNEKQYDNGFNTTVTSGQGAFQVTFPDGMGEIIKPLDSDTFYVMGTHQPDFDKDGPTDVKEMESFGTDAPSLFSIVIHDNFSEPIGKAEDYTLVNGKENSIQGKKYIKIYEQDELVGIGYQRFKGDRDYEYVFPLPGGKEMRIFYSVYGADPHNNLETIEAIIETIRLK